MKFIHYVHCLFSLLYFFNGNAAYLFEHCKELDSAIAYMSFADLPTPIDRCHTLGNVLGYHNIFIKRDDLTGFDGLYGGNKVRKLEFLLADALQQGAKKIVTFGCVGTNHGLATACYARQLGLDCLLMLKHQPNSPVVRQNLLLDHYFNAEIQIFANNEIRNSALNNVLANNKDIYFFPTGGSVPLGVLGYVNAAFELKKQIQHGVMPEPDFIYLPIGSCGTTAGLLLGFALADIRSTIVAISVEPESTVDGFFKRTQELFFETNKLLNSCSRSIPLLAFPDEQLMINKDFCGTEYGGWMSNVDDAAQFMRKTEHINLEGTYSAKAFAAILADIENNVRTKDEVLLFWNTYCGLDFSHLTSTVDYKQLPAEVHNYFDDGQ